MIPPSSLRTNGAWHLRTRQSSWRRPVTNVGDSSKLAQAGPPPAPDRSWPGSRGRHHRGSDERQHRCRRRDRTRPRRTGPSSVTYRATGRGCSWTQRLARPVARSARVFADVVGLWKRATPSTQRNQIGVPIARPDGSTTLSTASRGCVSSDSISSESICHVGRPESVRSARARLGNLQCRRHRRVPSQRRRGCAIRRSARGDRPHDRRPVGHGPRDPADPGVPRRSDAAVRHRCRVPTHPAWYFNLRAHPSGHGRVRRRDVHRRRRQLLPDGRRRTALVSRQAESTPQLVDYVTSAAPR